MKPRTTFEAHVSEDNLPFRLRKIPARVEPRNDPDHGPAALVRFGRDHGYAAFKPAEARAFADRVSDAIERGAGMMLFPTSLSGDMPICIGGKPPSRRRVDLRVRLAPPIGRPCVSIYLTMDEMTRFAQAIRAAVPEAE